MEWALNISARTPYVEVAIERVDHTTWFFKFHFTNSLSFLSGMKLNAAEANPTLYASERVGEREVDLVKGAQVLETNLAELPARHWFATDSPLAPLLSLSTKLLSCAAS